MPHCIVCGHSVRFTVLPLVGTLICSKCYDCSAYGQVALATEIHYNTPDLGLRIVYNQCYFFCKRKFKNMNLLLLLEKNPNFYLYRFFFNVMLQRKLKEKRSSRYISYLLI